MHHSKLPIVIKGSQSVLQNIQHLEQFFPGTLFTLVFRNGNVHLAEGLTEKLVENGHIKILKWQIWRKQKIFLASYLRIAVIPVTKVSTH